MASAVSLGKEAASEIGIAPDCNSDDREVNIDPKGWQILVKPYKMEEITEGGIIVPEQTKTDYDLAEMVNLVIELGPDCYDDKKKFPNGPRCKKGDLVICAPYSGLRISFKTFSLKLINDDSVLAVIDDPDGIKRI